jgi:hypothetical protein
MAMHILSRIIQWALAFIFAIAAGLKLAAFFRTTPGVSATLFDTLPVAGRWALVAVELLLAVWLSSGWRQRWAAFATIVLLSVFMGAVIVEMGKPIPHPCGCFGSSTGGSVMRGLWTTLIVDLVMLLGALVAYFQVPSAKPAMPDSSARPTHYCSLKN